MDWFVEHDGQRLVLDPSKVTAAFEEIRKLSENVPSEHGGEVIHEICERALKQLA